VRRLTQPAWHKEAALLAERSDVTEELARLRSHVEQFRKLLAGAGEAGKKTRFLLQEMQREATHLALQDSRRRVRRPGDHYVCAGSKSDIENSRTGAKTSNDERPSASGPLVCSLSPGSSGSGKSTLVAKMLEVPGRCFFDLQHHCGPPRTTESPGKWYDFISEEEFDRRASQGEFLEYARVFGKHWYGTPRPLFAGGIACKGLDLVLEIDVQGAEQVKQKLPAAVAIFILPPARDDSSGVYAPRGQDSEEANQAAHGAGAAGNPRYNGVRFLVVNDDVERAGREGCRRLRWERVVFAVVSASAHAKFWNPLEGKDLMTVESQAPDSKFAFGRNRGSAGPALIVGAMPWWQIHGPINRRG